MAIDFMGVMRKCAKCRSPDETVCWSKQFYMYVCDDCLAEIFQEIENATDQVEDEMEQSDER